MLVARGYNFACVKKRSNCTTVPRLLSMIVDIHTATSVECRAAVKEGVGGSLSVSLGFFVL